MTIAISWMPILISRSMESADRDITIYVLQAELFDHGLGINVEQLETIISAYTRIKSTSHQVYHPTPNAQVRLPLSKIDRVKLLEALERNGFHRDRTAVDIGVSPRTLYRLMKRFDLMGISGKKWEEVE